MSTSNYSPSVQPQAFTSIVRLKCKTKTKGHATDSTTSTTHRYSDSDDEDKPSNFNRPQWADSPELRRALEQQSTFNPDELFGPIKPLSMEELFKVRTGKFRNRTSSANWGGGDRLTAQEEVEYAKKMGFRSK